jgi:serine/threonine protein kinase/predicted Zn-dependent protease
MKSVIQCPSEAELAAFVRGEVPAERVEAIAEHLDACANCRLRWEQDPAEHAFDDGLRRADRAGREVQVDVSVPLRQLREALPEYEVVRELGRGGMGIVFEARHLTLKRNVALKVLPALLGAVRAGATQRFQREAELAARLKHTNIISVYDFGAVDGTLFYTMELVEGRSLRDILREIEETGAIDVVLGDGSGSGGSEGATKRRSDGGVATDDVGCGMAEVGGKSEAGGSSATRSIAAEPSAQCAIRNPKSKIQRLGSSSRTDRAYYRRVATWMADVAEALDYAHEQGVIHRDVKPSNLLLAFNGRLMISDFGLAKAAGGGTSAGGEPVTATQALLGTARYMSPEQVDDSRGAIDRRVDVYGLGATLYEMLAFRPMFAGADDREVLDCVLNREPAPPQRFVRQVPRELETICLKAVEKDRGSRYATAKELADDLRRWLLDLPIHARRPSLARRVAKFVRRRKAAAALGAALVVMLLGSGLLYARYVGTYRAARAAQGVAESQTVEVLFLQAQNELFRQGRYAAALTKIDAALALEPDALRLMLARAQTLRHLKRPAEAVACLEEILRRKPDSWQAHVNLAMAYHDLGDDARAAEHNRQAEELNPDPAEALRVRAALEPDPQKALHLLDQALALEPGSTASLIDRSWRYYALQQYDAMLMDVQQLAGAHPNWAFVQANRGLALFNLGRHAEAEEAYGRAVELDAEWPRVWCNRSAARVMTGRFAEALADANEAIRQDPEDSLAYFNRAKARRGLGDLEQALADCDRALRLDSANVQFPRERGFLLGEMGRWPDSADAYNRALQLAPDSALDYANRGVAYLESKQYDRAIADFTKCLEREPGEVRVQRSRAYAYWYSGRYEQAAAGFTQALALVPDYAEDYDNRSLCLMRLGRYAAAAADLTRLLELRGRDSKTRLRRGQVYELAADGAQAAADYAAVAAEGGPAGEYAVLWQYLLLRQMGQEPAAAAVLSSHAPGAGGEVRTGRFFELFAGTLTAADLLAGAATDDERAEAHFYIGRQALLNGDCPAARAAFEQCLALDRDVVETDFARALLNPLQESAPSSAPAP